jgi:hypothetical protein
MVPSVVACASASTVFTAAGVLKAAFLRSGVSNSTPFAASSGQ